MNETPDALKEAQKIVDDLKLLNWHVTKWPFISFSELAEGALRRQQIFKGTFILEDACTIIQHELILNYIKNSQKKGKKKHG